VLSPRMRPRSAFGIALRGGPGYLSERGSEDSSHLSFSYCSLLGVDTIPLSAVCEQL
jgi:hypothetical protein